MGSQEIRGFTLSTAHIQKYVGEYVKGDDFAFQEEIRTTDLAIKSLIKKSLGENGAQKFFVNGWGQVISAAYLIEKNPSHLKTSDEFNQFLLKKLEEAIAKGTGINNPLDSLNVRGFTKPFMMHPTHPTHPGKFFDWKTVEIEKPVSLLNRFAKKASLEFSLFEGKLYLKINPEDEGNIFSKLWKTDFASLLQKNGYTELEKNKECPHITLVNSNVIANIREQFNKKYEKVENPKNFDSFFETIIKKINSELNPKEQFSETLPEDHLLNELSFKGLDDENLRSSLIETAPIQFTTLASTFSEDYSPFEEVVVAKLKAPCAEKALRILIDEVDKELGIKIPVQPTDSFHLTIATKYRKPNPSLNEELQTILNTTGKHATALNNYWQQFSSIYTRNSI